MELRHDREYGDHRVRHQGPARNGSALSRSVPTLLAAVVLIVTACGTASLTEANPSTETGISTTASTSTIAEWDYVALGSSFTGWASWPETYASFIEEDLGVRVTYYDKTINSLHSDTLLELIRNDDELRDLLANAEVITFGAAFSEWETPVMTYAKGRDCGGVDNQDCLREALADTVERTEAIFDELVVLRGPDEALMSAFKIGTWLVELFCEWDSECWRVLAGYFLDLFDSIERIAEERDIRVVDALEALHAPGVYEAPMNQNYLVADRTHLSEEGSAVVANLLRDLGYEPATGEG